MSYARSAVTRMTLDMSRPDLQRSETVTQGDTNRRWEVTLINGGAPFRLPPNWTAALTGIKPDGNGLQNGCSVVDGKIIYDFAAGKEIATCVGSYPVHFDIWDEVGELVASPKVYVNVLADVRPREGMKSQEEYGLLGNFIAQKNDLTEDIKNNTTQIGNLSERMTKAEYDIDLLTNTAQTQGDDITALKEKVTTAGTVTIHTTQWSYTTPHTAYMGFPSNTVKKGQAVLFIPLSDATKKAAAKARLSVGVDEVTDGGGDFTDYVLFVQAEEGAVPTVDLDLGYIVLRTAGDLDAMVALIGVDAYGTGVGGTGSGVDEEAVKALIGKEVPEWARAKQKPTYTPEEVKARPATWTPTAEEIGARPSTWMPTAADVGARPNTWTPTAVDVGADPKDTAAGKVKDHNEDGGSHVDIRLDVTTLRTMLETVIGTDTGKSMRAVAALVVAEIVGDASDSFDTLEEIAAWIEAHPNDVAAMVKRITDLETAMGGKVSKTDIINTLDSTALDKPLSAAMGAKLNTLLAEMSDELDGKVTAEQVSGTITNALKDYLTKKEAGQIYQPVGDYADRKTTEQALAGKQAKGNYLTREVADQTYQPKGAASTGSATVEIVLPSSDVAVVGREYNLYHSAIIYSDLPADALDISVTVSGGGQGLNYHECFRMTPTTAGEYTLTVYVRDKLCNATIAQKTMTLYVVENALDTVNNILILGDSYTDAGYYPAELQHNLSGGKIISLGTVTDTVNIDNKSLTVTHEGHSGWATWDFAGNYTDSLGKFNSSANKFRNPATNKFDLGYYLDTYHDGASITAIMLNLGENGVGANPTNIDGFVELVARIREYRATLPILIHMTIPQSPQDTKKTGGKYTSNYMARLWRDLMARLITEFDGVSNVHLVPVHAVIDMEHDLPTETVPVCARNTTTIVRPSDGHPSKIGYLKMADVYYAHLLKYMGEGEPIPEEPDEPTVTNLLDFSVATTSPVTTATPQNEFAVGYKISASNLSVDAQAYTTNTFKITKGQKIKVEGIKLINTGYTNYFRWWFFAADGSRPYGSYVNFASGEGASADCIVVDAENNCATIDTSLMNANFNNITQARFSFVPSGAYTDTVVKIIEEDEA